MRVVYRAAVLLAALGLLGSTPPPVLAELPTEAYAHTQGLAPDATARLDSDDGRVRLRRIELAQWPAPSLLLLSAVDGGRLEVELSGPRGPRVSHHVEGPGPHLVWALNHPYQPLEVVVRREGRRVLAGSIHNSTPLSGLPLVLDAAWTAEPFLVDYSGAEQVRVALPPEALPARLDPLLAVNGVRVAWSSFGDLSDAQLDTLRGFVVAGGVLMVEGAPDGRPPAAFADAELIQQSGDIHQLDLGAGEVRVSTSAFASRPHRLPLHNEPSPVERRVPANEWQAVSDLGGRLPLRPPVALLAVLLVAFSILAPIGAARMLRRGLRPALLAMPVAAALAALVISAVSFASTGRPAHHQASIIESFGEAGGLEESHLVLRTGWSGRARVHAPAGAAVFLVAPNSWRAAIPMHLEIRGAQTEVRLLAERPHAIGYLTFLRYRREPVMLREVAGGIVNTGAGEYPMAWVLGHPQHGSWVWAPLVPDRLYRTTELTGEMPWASFETYFGKDEWAAQGLMSLVQRESRLTIAALAPEHDDLGVRLPGSVPQTEAWVMHVVRDGVMP